MHYYRVVIGKMCLVVVLDGMKVLQAEEGRGQRKNIVKSQNED